MSPIKSYFIFILVIVSLAGCLCLELDASNIAKQWSKFKKLYNKTYKTAAEDKLRRANFVESLELIERHSRNSSQSYKLGLNEFADLSRNEKLELMGFKAKARTKIGSIAMHDVQGRPREVGESELSKLISGWSQVVNERIEYVNWTEQAEVLGPVWKQGQCGSCWAISATGLLESRQRIDRSWDKDHQVDQLSIQQLIDCDTSNDGCAGGYPWDALTYVQSVGGLERNLDYPYVDFKNPYKHECTFNSSLVHKSTKDLKSKQILRSIEGDEQLLKTLVAASGPVSIGIHAGDMSFLFYESGIFEGQNCKSSFDSITHGMLLVGYGHDHASKKDYWIVKNSWGTGWGNNGYGLMLRNANNRCAIATIATFVV